MATALGTTAPPEGESGTVKGVNHLADQLPDNPTTLAATTSIETLQQILYDNWVWKKTISFDASMLPGHVADIMRIHPYGCNDYVSHIARIFLAWTGSFKIRCRFMATYQFGGSIRVGFLPPYFTDAQILNMPVQTLSAYPNVDLDPKNTGWTTFEASDERNVLFHLFKDIDSDDFDATGGRFVFWVAAPIVLSGAGSSISLLVEAAGDFNFAQLRPISEISDQINAWMPTGSENNILQQLPCDDDGTITHLQVMPNTITTFSTGLWFAKGTGNRYTSEVVQGAIVGSEITLARSGWQPVISTPTDYIRNGGGAVYHGDITGEFLSATAELGAVRGIALYDSTVANALKIADRKIFAGDGTVGSELHNIWRVAEDAAPAVTFHGDGMLFHHEIVETPIDYSKCVITNDTTSIKNPLPDESIIGFANLRYRTISFQTKQIGQSIALQPATSTNSQLYLLFQGSSTTPFMTVRLQCNGMLSCMATDVPALLTSSSIYARYLQDLPMTTPLPSSVSQGMFLDRAAKLAVRGHTTQRALRTKLWNRFT